MDNIAFDYDKLITILYPDSKVIKLNRLGGGTTFEIEKLEIETPKNELKKVILRKFTGKNLSKYSQKVLREFKLQKLLNSYDIKVPNPIFVNSNSNSFPFPFIVLEYIEGQTEFNPLDIHDFIIKYTENLYKIHKINHLSNDYSFLPLLDTIIGQTLVNMANDKKITEKESNNITQLITFKLNNQVILHGDYWPGNILWENNTIVATIDWEDSCLGDPLLDVANSRLELLWAFNKDVMNEFTELYKQKMPEENFTLLPLWDLFIAKRITGVFNQWDLNRNESKKEKMIKDHRWFEQQATELLKII